MTTGKFSAAAIEGVPSPPPLFIDTNLDTHLAMVVTPDDTIADLKRKVSMEHAVCFPNIGDITVLSMKVRRRATFYHLSDSMLVKTAFDGTKGTWFLHMDVAPINNDGDALGGDTNKTEWGVTNGPSSVDGLIRVDSSLKLTDSPLPDVTLPPCMSGGNQASRVELPLSVLLVNETNCEALQNKSGAVKPSGECENSAPNGGNNSDVFDPETVGAFFEGNGVSSSHLQLAPVIPTDKMKRDVKGKDFANLIDMIDGGDASIIVAEKEKSRQSGLTLEDACLLKPSSEKKRHNKEEGKQNSSSWKDHDKYLLQVHGTGAVLPENGSRDNITGVVGVLGEVASDLPKDGLGMPQELLDDKKKRKKKRRKESNEFNTETNAFIHFKTIDNFEDSTLRTGLSEHASKENDLSLGKKTNEENQEEAFPSNDNYQKDDLIMPQGRLSDTKKRKKKRRKESNECNNETDEINEEKPEEVPADSLKHLATEPNMEIVPKEPSRLGNAVETLPEAPPDDIRSLAHSKKRSGKTRSSKVRSGKDGAFSSVADIPEKATVISENFTEANFTPLNKKSSSHSKKTLVQTKKSCTETPCEEDTPITGPAGSAKQSLTDKCAGPVNEIATFDEALMPETTQHGLVNTDHGHVIKASHKRKIQRGTTANSDLVDPPKGPATKHPNKSHKQKTAKALQVIHQNDDGRGKSDMSHGDTSPHLPSLKSSQDNQLSENHESFSGSELNKPARLAGVKRSMDYLGTNAHIGQQKAGGNRDNSVKEINANPAGSSDNTEEDTPSNEKHYRVVVRKIIKSIPKNDLNNPKQEGIYNTVDNISDHFTSTSSEAVHKENKTKKNVSDNSTSDDSEEGPEQIQFIREPITQLKSSSQGMPSPSAHLHEKEISSDDIPLSQTSNATKKRIALGVLLRGSHSYRKAKLTAQSQADDTESQPIDAVPETQPDSL